MDEKTMSEGQDRRTFLKNALSVGGTVLAGSSLLGACAPAAQGGVAGAGSVRGAVGARPPIGLQLYTVRDQLQRDFEGTIARVAEIGYQELEFAGYYNRTPEQVRALLDRLNLRAPSAHLGLNLFRDNLEATLAASETMGHRYVVVPAARAEGAAAWRQLAADFNRYGAAARQRGLRFGYHNHAWEFEDLGGGVTAYDILLRETDPALVDLELDLYWAIRGGRRPVEMFARNPGRFKLWHVKDMTDMSGTQAMVPVGAGEVNFAEIFASARTAGMEHFFVEHDNAADTVGSIESVTTSYQNLRRMLP